MTCDYVLNRIEEIRKIADEGDDELAHGREDILHQDVLTAIADGAPDAVKLARLALTTREIQFSRWSA